MKANNQPANIDDYISQFAPSIQKKLSQMRATIKRAAPGAEEHIKYGIPTFTLQGNLVHFAAYATHIGFYPSPSGIEAFRTDLASYHVAKGTVQFPLTKPLPLRLISKIVKLRVLMNLEKADAKRKGNI